MLLLVLLFILLPPLIILLTAIFTESAVASFFSWLVAIFVLIYLAYTNFFSSRRGTGFLGNEEEFLDAILQLAALTIQADGKISEVEVEWVESKLREDFKEKYHDQFIQDFRDCLEREISLEKVCRSVNRDFSFSSKIQLINFLIKITAVDNKISEEEYQFLNRLSRLFRLNKRLLHTLLASAGYERREKREKGYSRQKQQSSSMSISRCYNILGISSTATDREVKKAYRKLASIHHPDKVAHLGEKFQDSAHEKFQKISEAYETIKTKRGFS